MRMRAELLTRLQTKVPIRVARPRAVPVESRLMADLHYRSGTRAASERRARRRLNWFGPSYGDVWRIVADEIGARHESSFWRGDRVVARVGPWEVVLELCLLNKVTFTRVRAPYVNADGFRFNVFRKHLLSGVAEWLGFQDVRVGYAKFDEAFVIRGNDEGKLKLLFDNPRLRQLLSAQPHVAFRVIKDEGVFRRIYPEGVDQLQFLAAGAVKDIDRLKALFELFAETLDTLCAIGSAYEDAPGAPRA